MKLNPVGLLLAGLGVVGAFLLTTGTSTPRYEDQMLKVAVRQTFGDSAPEIANESPEIQALLLDYADNEPLLLNARLALLVYPDQAHRILPTYGDEPEFQEVLLKYGEAALPPISYFMDHDLNSLKVRLTVNEWLEKIKFMYGRLIDTSGEVTPLPAEAETKLTAEERGWFAIHFLLDEGYDLLGQFAITSDGKADWVQTERIMEGFSDFFFGGVRSLETKWRLEEDIESSDWGRAALDAAVIAASVKLLKATRTVRAAKPAATTARAGGFSGRVAVFGSRVLAHGGRMGVAVARLGAIPAAVYLMFRYPSLINSTLAELANWLGISPWWVQFLFWLVAIWITFILARFLLGPLSWVLRSVGWVTGTLANWPRKPHGRDRAAFRADTASFTRP